MGKALFQRFYVLQPSFLFFFSKGLCRYQEPVRHILTVKQKFLKAFWHLADIMLNTLGIKFKKLCLTLEGADKLFSHLQTFKNNLHIHLNVCSIIANP